MEYCLPARTDFFRNFESLLSGEGFLALATLALGLGITPIVRSQTTLSLSSEKKDVKSVIDAEWIIPSADGSRTAKTSAVCVEKDGWFVCLMPGGETSKTKVPELFLNNESGVATKLEIKARYPESRLCLARAESIVAKPVNFSTSTPKPGTDVVCASGPGSKGKMAGFDQQYRGEALPVSMYRVHLAEETNAPSPGRPLFSNQGELIGLTSDRKLKGKNEVHVIPACVVSKLVADYKRHQKTGQIWIGASFHRESTTPEVLKVAPGSPAETAGIRPGDVILQMGAQEIATFSALVEHCKSLPAGDTVSVKVLRNLETIECKLAPVLASERK